MNLSPRALAAEVGFVPVRLASPRSPKPLEAWTMLFSRSLLASLLLCMITCGLAYAQGAHYGSADPETEGWTIQTTAGGAGVAKCDGALGSVS